VDSVGPDLNISDFSIDDFDLEPADQQFLLELLTEHEAQLGPEFAYTVDSEHMEGEYTLHLWTLCICM